MTRWIQDRANELLAAKQRRRAASVAGAAALKASTTHQEDLVRPYVDDLGEVIDMDAIRDAEGDDRRRSARRRVAAVLAGDRRSATA